MAEMALWGIVAAGGVGAGIKAGSKATNTIGGYLLSDLDVTVLRS